MKTIVAAISAGLSMLSLAAAVAHAQANPRSKATDPAPNRLEPAPAGELRSDSNVFRTFEDGAQTFREEAERFRDPQYREAVRAQQREQILESHQGIGELLQLDAETQSKLIELLADQQTANQERFYTGATARTSRSYASDLIRTRAEHETEKVQALRDLLGQEKLERYQAFAVRVNEYRQVAQFDARLDADHKLGREQKTRLAELYHEQTKAEIDRHRSSMRLHIPFPGTPMQQPRGELRDSRLTTITTNEERWRRMPKDDERFRRRAAQFLTPTQIGVLAQIQAEKSDELQRWIEDARAHAGLSREIPERAEAPGPQLPPTVDGKVKVAVKLSIDGGDATHFTQTTRNGKSVTFRCREGLFVEVRPTVYVDDTFDVTVLYYEEGSNGGRRLVGESGQMGAITRTSSGAAGGGGSGSSGSVITGNRGYAVQLSTQIEPV